MTKIIHNIALEDVTVYNDKFCVATSHDQSKHCVGDETPALPTRRGHRTPRHRGLCKHGCSACADHSRAQMARSLVSTLTYSSLSMSQALFLCKRCLAS